MKRTHMVVAVLLVTAMITSIAAAFVYVSPAVTPNTGTTLDIASGNSLAGTNTYSYIDIGAKKKKSRGPNWSDITTYFEAKKKHVRR